MKHLAKPEHEVAYQDLVALMRRHADKMTAEEMLAVGGNMLGKMIAMQDRATMSPDRALQIVSLNIQEGNDQVLAMHAKGEI